MSTKIGTGEKLAKQAITDDMYKWLGLESKKTLESRASVVRRVLQREVDKAIKSGFLKQEG